MKLVVRTLAAISAIIVPATALSQEVAFIKCKWASNGAERIYKVSASNWSSWNRDSWSWNDFSCEHAPYSNTGKSYGPNGFMNDELKCTATFTDKIYAWTMKGLNGAYIDKPPSGFEERLFKSWLVDRQSGTISFRYEINGEAWGRYTATNEQEADNGTCDRTTDPALQPRPAPPPPRL